MIIKPFVSLKFVLPALTALALGMPGAYAETKPKQPAADTKKAKDPATTAEAKPKQPAPATKPKAKDSSPAAEAKPKAKASAAEAKPKPKEPAPAPASESKPKPVAATEPKAKQPAEAVYTLSEKSNLRKSASRKNYSPVWLAKGARVESYPVEGSFKKGDWRHVIVRDGQDHAGSQGWLRRDWLDYKGRGK